MFSNIMTIRNIIDCSLLCGTILVLYVYSPISSSYNNNNIAYYIVIITNTSNYVNIE